MKKPTSVGKMRALGKIALAVSLSLMIGCVSTSNSRFKNNVDEDEALRKYTELGLAYIQQGNTVDAMPPLKRALEIDPKSPNVHAALALLFQVERDVSLSETYFKNALKYSDGVERTRIRNNYANFLFRAERLIDACDQLKLASEDAFYEKRSQVYENLGVCYQRLGKNTDALAAYERAVSIDGSRSRALLEASFLQFNNSNFSLSEQYHSSYERMVRYRMAPHTPKSLWLGVQLSRLSFDKNAEASYALKLRNMFPDSPENKDILKGG